MISIFRESILKIKSANDKYDIWSLFSDFFFLVGVFVLDWNPVLLIIWYMIDTVCMLLFGIILVHKESSDWMDTVIFVTISPMMIFLLFGLYRGVEDFIVELKMEDQVISDPNLVINSYLLPIMLVCSTLGHYAEYSKDIERMNNGTYNSAYLKHFFLRYILIYAFVLFLIFFYVYFQMGIVILLLGMKAILRVFYKKFREII